jgi:hypothetical protein
MIALFIPTVESHFGAPAMIHVLKSGNSAFVPAATGAARLGTRKRVGSRAGFGYNGGNNRAIQGIGLRNVPTLGTFPYSVGACGMGRKTCGVMTLRLAQFVQPLTMCE